MDLREPPRQSADTQSKRKSKQHSEERRRFLNEQAACNAAAPVPLLYIEWADAFQFGEYRAVGSLLFFLFLLNRLTQASKHN